MRFRVVVGNPLAMRSTHTTTHLAIAAALRRGMTSASWARTDSR
jgi:hypothetical protein